MSLNKQYGFSLIEMVIVVACLAILSIIAMQVFGDQQGKARDARRKAHIEQLHKGVEQFYTEENEYPTAATYADLQTILASKYLRRITDVKDPLNRDEYVYWFEGTTASYCICAKLEKDTDGNSGAECDFAGANTHFCKKNIQ